MKKHISLSLALLIGLFIQTPTNFAQMGAPTSETILDLGALNGRAKTLGTPVYSETAKKAGVVGAVRVNVTVDEQGKVVKADAVSGEMLLRDSAIAAARASTFTPNMVKGKPAKMRGFLIFTFPVSPTAEDLEIFSDYLKSSETDFWGTFTKLQKESQGSPIVAKKLDQNACLIVIFKVLNKATYKSKLVDSQTLNTIVKSCDESIKSDSTKPFRFYNRGLARYYLIRGDESPLGITLQGTTKISGDDLRQSLTDVKAFIDWESNYRFPDELKMAYRAAGELTAVLAVKEGNREGLAAALRLLDTAEKSKAMLDTADVYTNKIIAMDRKVIESIIGNDNSKGATSTLTNEISSRYQKYSGEFAALEAVYKIKVRNFQEILKSQQGVPKGDSVKVCEALSDMNAAFQAMKSGFSKISEMKNKGELSNDSNLVKQIESREAQHASVQSNFSAAAAKYGCQLQ